MANYCPECGKEFSGSGFMATGVFHGSIFELHFCSEACTIKRLESLGIMSTKERVAMTEKGDG